MLNGCFQKGLERHLLGTHGLVTSSMQEAANKGKDAGRCPICGKVCDCFIPHSLMYYDFTLIFMYLIFKKKKNLKVACRTI